MAITTATAIARQAQPQATPQLQQQERHPSTETRRICLIAAQRLRLCSRLRRPDPDIEEFVAAVIAVAVTIVVVVVAWWWWLRL